MGEKEIQEIIYAAMENFSASDPPDPILPEHWILTDKELRSMLAICIERVRERMLDPIEVGRKMAELSATQARFAYGGREVSAEECVKKLCGELHLERQLHQITREKRDHARGLIAKVLQELPVAGKDNDDVYAVWNALYKGAHWLHPETGGGAG